MHSLARALSRNRPRPSKETSLNMVTFGRFVRGAAAAVVLAVMPLSSLSVGPAVAQGVPPGIPGMTPFLLTNELVLAFVASYPVMTEAGNTLEQRYNIPDTNDAAAAFAAYAAYAGAMAELNGIAVQNGFTDYNQWLQTMIAIMTAFAFADPALTVQERTMMQAFMPPAMLPPPENIEIITANYAAVAAVMDN
jgi:hypothetical protein